MGLSQYMRKIEEPAIAGTRKGYTGANLFPNKYTGFQQNSILIETGFTGIRKLEIEIDKDYDAVVGFAIYRMEGVSYATNTYLSVTSDEGTLISSTNARVFYSDIDDMRKDKYFFPLFVKNTANGRKVSFVFDIKRAHGEDIRYFVMLMLKNKAYPYPYEFDFFTHKKTLTEAVGTIANPYQLSFQLEPCPSTFTECIGFAVSPQNRNAEPYFPTMADIGIRRGFSDTLSLIPALYLYLKPFPMTSSLERFFPLYIPKINNEILEAHLRAYESITANNKYIELIFLLRRKSHRTNVR